MQVDDSSRNRVISYQSCEKNYPVHLKDLLSINYPLLTFWVHLMVRRRLYSDHASLCSAVNSLIYRRVRSPAFFFKFNFRLNTGVGKRTFSRTRCLVILFTKIRFGQLLNFYVSNQLLLVRAVLPCIRSRFRKIAGRRSAWTSSSGSQKTPPATPALSSLLTE